MNAVQNIKILKMYLQFGGGCIRKTITEIKNLDKYKYISNLQRKNILENKTKIRQFTLVKI